MARPLIVGDIEYNKEESLALREEIIVLRDEALKQAEFEWAVKLSHVVAWMAIIIEERFND
jgi:hypothetical protein